MKRVLFAAALFAALVAAALLRPGGNDVSATVAIQDQGLTLVTATPDEGFALAVTLSRRGVTTTQPDREVLHALRPEYASDADARSCCARTGIQHWVSKKARASAR